MILQTTDVKLMGLNCLGSVVREVFATRVTIAQPSPQVHGQFEWKGYTFG